MGETLMGHTSVPQASTVKDPVCGMTVKTDAPHRAEHQGKTYYFCSAGCRAKFDSDPGRYLAPPRPGTPVPHGHEKPPATAKARLWTCPMHPQIVRDGPGSCPICGMALEPMSPSVGDGENPELVEMPRRLWVGSALVVPLLFFSGEDGPSSFEPGSPSGTRASTCSL